MEEVNNYDIKVIRNAFVNAVVPTTRLIITHLERLLYGSTINQTAKDDTSITLHIESPIWRKGEHYTKDFKFVLNKRNNEYKILNVIEQ